MTNIVALVVTALVTNVLNVQVHDGCGVCATNPAHVELVPAPRNVRREETVVLEQTSLVGIRFEFEGIPHAMPLPEPLVFHNRTVSRVVRRYKKVEEEVK